MSLRFALLALLGSRPMTGYDLSKHFSQSVAHVWHAPDSQIYPELNRMERDGLLESVPVALGPEGDQEGVPRHRRRAGGVPRVDRLAPGDQAAAGPGVPQGGLPGVGRRGCRPLPAAAASRLLVSAPRRCSSTPGRRSSTAPTPPWPTGWRKYPADQHERIVRYKVFAYDGLIDQARAEIAWAERGLALVDELEGASAQPG